MQLESETVALLPFPRFNEVDNSATLIRLSPCRFDRRGGAPGDADRDGISSKFDRDSRFYDARPRQDHPQWAAFHRDSVVKLGRAV